MHPNDPIYAANGWHFTRIGDIERIFDEFSGAGVHVGIYDSGVESDHPDLAANYDASLHVIIDGNPVSGEPNATTPDGHGTLVAGIVGATANNGLGSAGVAWGATLTSVPILDPDSPVYLGNLDFTNILSAIHQMAAFDITNNSWNALSPNFGSGYNLHNNSQSAQENVEFAYVSAVGRDGLGTVIVQGAGNNNLDAQGAGLNTSRFTITVAAVGYDGFAADFSNYGACVLVTAPGFQVPGTDLTGAASIPGDYSFGTGTSFATPIVSGVAALMLQANPNLGWRDVQDILAASATHTGSAIGAVALGTNENSFWFFNDAADWNGGGRHFSNDYGYGVVSAYNAVRMAEAWSLFQPSQTSANERQWFNWDDTDVAIPDFGSGTLQRSLNLLPDPDMELEHVDVILGLTHTDFTQLRIFLTAPGGTEVQLYDGLSGDASTADGGLTWTFGVDALRGENPEGLWTVRIEDKVAGDTGTLTYFEVGAFGKTAFANDTYHYTDEFLAMKALQASRGTLADTDGGSGWIDAAAVTGNFVLNLAAGTSSTVNGTTWFTIAGGTSIENAVTGDGNDSLTGNSGSNILYGMRGNDTLNGGAGGDAMHGGKGNDTYVVDNGLDTIDEFQESASGIDIVLSSLSFSLANTARVTGDIENLTLLNVATALTATGNGLANVLIGNNFNNTLKGGGGTDSLRGGLGSDTYVLENGNDGVIDSGGVDTATSTVSRSIAALATVDNLTLLNVAAALSGTGNNLGNTITGNNFNNSLSGGNGNDRLLGGVGNDTLTGGVGIDTLSGNAGNDAFVFNAPLSAANRDVIADFANASGNNDIFRLENAVMIRLGAGVHALSAGHFWAGASAHDPNDYVVYNRATGVLSYDSNGNAAGGVTQLATLNSKPVLTAADFFVI